MLCEKYLKGGFIFTTKEPVPYLKYSYKSEYFKFTIGCIKLLKLIMHQEKNVNMLLHFW